MLTVNASRDPLDNPGYRRVFRTGRLTLGLMLPIEAFAGDEPRMTRQVELAQYAEAHGFDALWLRDVPLRDPTFGDVGQVFDTFVYLGYLAAHTRTIALGTAAIVLPHRHPLHTAKAVASADQLSGGRLLLGVASGDRPVEFPAFGVDITRRAEIFREHLDAMRTAWGRHYPLLAGSFGRLANADLVPKPWSRGVPVLVTGRSGQDMEWIAQNAHGWMTYPRPPAHQAVQVDYWREVQRSVTGEDGKPFLQSLYIDLLEDSGEPPVPIHLGYRLGSEALVALLRQLHGIGVAHVILNLKYGSRDAAAVVQQLAREVLPALGEVGYAAALTS
ncbi:MAG: LLM class oxidoreductase [Burkholderiales bacterium]|nr:LLM class oxidoreductase [Burkholderiales bacterium]